jgi:hypothetical protein
MTRNGLLSRAVVRASAAAVCAAAAALALTLTWSPAIGAQAAIEMLPTPAAAGSNAYAMAAGHDGKAYLVWIEPAGADAQALKFSRFDGRAWNTPRDIARGSNWFVNWADHPSIAAMPDGSLLAHWLVNTGRKAGSYGYFIRVARSADDGANWSTVFEDGTKNVADYAGFLTFSPTPQGADAIYLAPLSPDDGTSHGHDDAEHIKTLAAVSFTPNGTVTGQKVVDADVCSCCMTDIAQTSQGPIAVYRDHLPGDIRDISIVRRVKGEWTAPAPVFGDGWHIPGCPTNGPAVAARGDRVAVAWFTAAQDTPRLKMAFSDDAGATFAAPVVIDDGRPVGWPDVTMMEDGSAIVSWLERRGEGRGEILVRRVSTGRAPGVPVVVTTAVSGRATGVPHMVRLGDRLLLAWRAERVLTAAVPIASILP